MGRCKDKVILVLEKSDLKEPMCNLEKVLIRYGVEYDIQLNDGKMCLKPPFLIINGAMLDEVRSLKWLAEVRT